ncbi:MAG TPA: peptidase [Pusillimonas sp.]|jgi:uncharacterized membrane protein YkoI|nr:peptidase [Pusillimonas sp.]|tara:strand:+ start:168854 stop:169162 length:309 start_codon:yes stop_codon:yes gene_type:complete
MQPIKMKWAAAMVLAVASVAVHADDVRVDEAFRLASDGIIKSFDSLNQTVLDTRQGRITDTELENNRGNYVYKVTVLDSKGQEWEIKVDAVTGKVIEEELDN